MTALVVIAFAFAGLTSAPPPQQSAEELNAIVERVVRVAELHRQRLELERELAGLTYGESHPVVLDVRRKLNAVVSQIRRENLEATRADVRILAARQHALEGQLAGMHFGSDHPLRRSAETELNAVKEQQRVAAVAALASGVEAELKALVAARPTTFAPYLELADLYALAGRNEDAAAMLTQALAVLKLSGGR